MIRLSSSRLLVAGVLLLALTGCPKKEPVAKDKGTPTGGKLLTPTPDFTLGAVDLAKEYETDAMAADLKYKGKWLLLEGTVSDITLGHPGEVTVFLEGFNKDPQKSILGHSARCLVHNDDKAKSLDLTKGQKVKFKGECNGGALVHFVDLLHAELVEVGTDPAIVVSAEQLAKDFSMDAASAKAKYGDKWLLLTGTVVEREKGISGADFVVLQGSDEKADKAIRVEAAYPAEGKRFFEKLTKGDKVKIKGECGGFVAGAVSVNYSRLIP